MEGFPISLEHLFGQLEDLILNSPKVPLTNKIIIDEDRLIDLIDHIRADLPSEFRHAQEICAQREGILQEAQREAEAVKVNAERLQKQMLTETEIYRLGQQEADRLIREAHIQIHEQQQQADHYADEVLAELESKIGKALATIKNGRQYLGAGRN
jgi:hypothetical protein